MSFAAYNIRYTITSKSEYLEELCQVEGGVADKAQGEGFRELQDDEAMRQDAYRGEIVGKRGVRQVDGRFNDDRGLSAQDRISQEIQLEPVCFMELEPGF